MSNLTANAFFIAAAITCFLMLPSRASSQASSCGDIKNGVFLYFSQADGTVLTYTRNGTVQKEVIPAKHEMVLWDVEWVNECSYILTYNSGLEDQPELVSKVWKKHKMYVQLLSVTNEYCVFQSSLDKPSNPILLKDTLWIKERRDLKNKLFTNPGIDSLLVVRKKALDSAISKSATLYLFRPGKFVESRIDCTIYLNDKPICEMTNNSSYVIRLLKEGQTTFYAKAGNQETYVTLDIKSGEKYFLRCDMLFSLPPKPKLTAVAQQEAQSYFPNIK